MTRIIQVGDTHLSRSHAYFWDNFAAFRAAMRADPPALIVHGGDLSFNGPVAEDDLRFGAACMAELGLPWCAVAGNHDVGEAPGFSRLGQPVNAGRLAAWARHVGPAWWARDIGGWRLIGLDTSLMASGLPEEAAQNAFLDAALVGRGGRPVMVVMHMPPFDDDPEDPAPTTSVIPHPARARLLAACLAGGVRAIACGHLHIHRHLVYRGMDIVWAPATAMVSVERGLRQRGTFPRPGYVEWTLAGDTATHRLVEPETMFVLDMSRWAEANGNTVTTLPPSAPRP